MNTDFIEELASAAPTPGGGGAAAYAGALAAALASMVGNLTVGKKAYAQVEPEVQVRLTELSALRERLVALVDEDARAFAPLAAAYRMPKETSEQQAAKAAAIQSALAGACEPPLAIMRAVRDVVAHVEFMADQGSRMALSDAGVAAAFARAAADGASLNVFINAKSMDDAALADALRGEAESIISDVRCRCDAVFSQVKSAVS